jgi:hypothetical protein
MSSTSLSLSSSSCYNYRLVIPQNKEKLSNLIEKYPNILRLTTFQNTKEELQFLHHYEKQNQSNSNGETYIRDILWLETNEIIGISGLIVENNIEISIGYWMILLLEPLATYEICEQILQEYFEVARCLLIDQIQVRIPQKFKTIANILHNNGFFSDDDSEEEMKLYTWDINERLSESYASPSCEADSAEVCDEDILCRGCGQYFLFTAEEHLVYLEKGIDNINKAHFYQNLFHQSVVRSVG